MTASRIRLLKELAEAKKLIADGETKEGIIAYNGKIIEECKYDEIYLYDKYFSYRDDDGKLIIYDFKDNRILEDHPVAEFNGEYALTGETRKDLYLYSLSGESYGPIVRGDVRDGDYRDSLTGYQLIASDLVYRRITSYTLEEVPNSNGRFHRWEKQSSELKVINREGEELDYLDDEQNYWWGSRILATNPIS